MRCFLLLLLLPACNPTEEKPDDSTVAVSDSDKDGFLGGEDCNDADATINPDATELCDGLDNNCDGVADEGVSSPFWADDDGDGFGDPNTKTESCTAPDGYVSNDQDCVPTNEEIYPGAPEICDDIDNNCSGETDEGLGVPVYVDEDGDGYGSRMEYACALSPGYSAVGGDCDDATHTIFPGATEFCDGIDNDCDGTVDEEGSDATTWYYDADGDGYGNCAVMQVACDPPAGYVAAASTESCDCNDGTAAAHPYAVELCDGVLDEDCDGQTDESDAIDAGIWYADGDGDGYGDVLSATSACEAPAGYVVDTTDCEDQQASIHPGAAELCDGLDQDCDGAADDGLSFVNWYTDSDGDGYGDPASAQSACTQPASTLADGSDCDDADATVHPSAPEVCDGNDQDCDGIADNGLPIFVVYTDSDGDGYGAGAPRVWCEVLAGRSTVDGDCDNQDAAINPAAQEVCNGVDDDCDQLLDATDPSVSGAVLYYADQDGDGFGDAGTSVLACSQPAGYDTDSADCNDQSAAISPICCSNRRCSPRSSCE